MPAIAAAIAGMKATVRPGTAASEAARSARRLGRHPRHDGLGQVGHLFGRTDRTAVRTRVERSSKVRQDAQPARWVSTPSRWTDEQVRPVHARGDERLHVSTVHVVASSSPAIARHSAWRARNIRLFTVPTATPSTSEASW